MPSPSKIRYRQRARLKAADTFAILKAEGSSCAGCRWITPHTQFNKSYCEAHSDFHGTCYVLPTDLCIKWIPKQ